MKGLYRWKLPVGLLLVLGGLSSLGSLHSAVADRGYNCEVDERWGQVYAVDGEGGGWLYQPEWGWVYAAEADGDVYWRQDTESWLLLLDGVAQGWAYDWALESFVPVSEPGEEIAVRSVRALREAVVWTVSNAGRWSNYSQYPVQTDNNGWKMVPSSNWTAGFWPGLLWMLSDYAGDAALEQKAKNWLTSMGTQMTNETTHDVGFMLECSYGYAYRITGSVAYRSVLQTTAGSLATRFSPVVGATRSWSWGSWVGDGKFTVIADNMMNMELLLRAARAPGGNPQWREMAIAHADTALRDFVREDGSVYHVVVYNENTGAIIEKTTHQGAATESAWARGQAWMLYGFTVMYRETGEVRYLEAARRLASYYVENLPEDWIPWWDFRASGIPNVPRDTSAAAVAASGLIELAELEEDAELADLWMDAAQQSLRSLTREPYWGWVRNGYYALLAQGTYNAPGNNTNTGLIWGDYYVVEAMLRYLGLARP